MSTDGACYGSRLTSSQPWGINNHPGAASSQVCCSQPRDGSRPAVASKTARAPSSTGDATSSPCPLLLPDSSLQPPDQLQLWPGRCHQRQQQQIGSLPPSLLQVPAAIGVPQEQLEAASAPGSGHPADAAPRTPDTPDQDALPPSSAASGGTANCSAASSLTASPVVPAATGCAAAACCSVMPSGLDNGAPQGQQDQQDQTQLSGQALLAAQLAAQLAGAAAEGHLHLQQLLAAAALPPSASGSSFSASQAILPPACPLQLQLLLPQVSALSLPQQQQQQPVLLPMVLPAARMPQQQSLMPLVPQRSRVPSKRRQLMAVPSSQLALASSSRGLARASSNILLLAPPSNPGYSAGFNAGLSHGLTQLGQMLPLGSIPVGAQGAFTTAATAATAAWASAVNPHLAAMGPLAAAALMTGGNAADELAMLPSSQPQVPMLPTLLPNAADTSTDTASAFTSQQLELATGCTTAVAGGAAAAAAPGGGDMARAPAPRVGRKRRLSASEQAAAVDIGTAPASGQHRAAAAAAAAHLDTSAAGPTPVMPASGCNIEGLLGVTDAEQAAARLASMSRAELFSLAARVVGSGLQHSTSSSAAAAAAAEQLAVAPQDGSSTGSKVSAGVAATLRDGTGAYRTSLPDCSQELLPAAPELSVLYSASATPAEAAAAARAAADVIAAAAAAAAAARVQERLSARSAAHQDKPRLSRKRRQEQQPPPQQQQQPQRCGLGGPSRQSPESCLFLEWSREDV